MDMDTWAVAIGPLFHELELESGSGEERVLNDDWPSNFPSPIPSPRPTRAPVYRSSVLGPHFTPHCLKSP